MEGFLRFIYGYFCRYLGGSIGYTRKRNSHVKLGMLSVEL